MLLLKLVLLNLLIIGAISESNIRVLKSTIHPSEPYEV